MCGIIGFIKSSREADQWPAILRGMMGSMTHRGPDSEGYWYDAEAGVGFGHRRLAILDLSPEGHQPMLSACQRFVLTYNGEIYNFRDLKERLEKLGHTFRGHSDTEVMLAAISQWGVETTLKRLVGMFAFALWDRQDRILYLARDRLGEKPLYYGRQGTAFLFGSELKALREHPAWQGDINRDALALFMRHNYIPAPYSIYRGIHKLLPGTFLALPLSGEGIQIDTAPIPYWSAREVAEVGATSPSTCTTVEAIEQLDQLLRQVVAGQMVADVPLGAFLSGGVDSSTIVALMQAQSERPVKTFTIGFHEAKYNEATYAKAVANHLGTDHTELYVTPDEARAVIPLLPDLYDEPFSDSSQIPTYLISKLARQQVTVSLSGDGGDELFGGYKRYQLGQDLWNKIRWLPPAGRATLARTIGAMPTEMLDRSLGWLAPTLNQYGRAGQVGDKLHKVSEVLAVDTPEALYRRLVSHWKSPVALVQNVSEEPRTVLTDQTQWAHLPDFTQQMMYLDTVTYLPDDILVKVDRASMGVSLESRVPLLDHRVVEFAWQLPLSMRVNNGTGKWLLRQVLYNYVPPALIERPKVGFGVPIGDWLRGPLREWAEALLDESRLRQDGFFDPAPILQKWTEHLTEKHNWHYYLWDVLMFQAWQERWLG